MLCPYPEAVWTGTLRDNALPDGTHSGCNFLFKQTELESVGTSVVSTAVSRTIGTLEEDAGKFSE
jgi:hypothetical protein